MLRITSLTGQSLELNKNTSIPVEKNNSLFSPDGTFVQDVIKFPGTAGLTDNNKLFIQNGHLIEAETGVYEFPVQVFVADYQFYKATFSYKIVKNQIEYILLVNFGAIVSKMKKAILKDIYTFDPVPGPGSAALMAAFMKDTCLNPKNYPFAFFPVYNDKWDSSAVAATSKWLNEWDMTAKAFKVSTDSNRGVPYYGLAPFFKLSHVIKKIAEYLKLDIAGEYLTSESADEIYLYHRKSLPGFGIGPTMSYLPAISINDFLKQIAERTKISFTFDLMNNRVVISTPQTALHGTFCNDISKYIESIDEKSVAEQKGYYVTLKVDESDEAMNRGTAEEKNFTPPFALVVGSGENKIEMAVGTLAMKKEVGYSHPIASQTFDTIREKVTEWPVRLLRFKGMIAVDGGKEFPQATAVELDGSDAEWYRFRNDSKKLIINAKIPPGVLAKISASDKIGGYDDKGAFFYAIPEKNNYNMTNRNVERISVRIDAHTIVRSYKTKYYIDKVNPVITDDAVVLNKFKGFWDPEVHGFTEFRVECVSLNGTETFGYTAITQSTDDGGIGGTVGSYFEITTASLAQRQRQLRCYSPIKPAYYIAGGFKGTFVQVGNYYTFANFPAGYYFDDKPIWIVF